MRTSPSFEVTIARFGVWFAGAGGLTACAAVVLGAWWFVRAPDVLQMSALVGSFAVVCLAVAAHAVRAVRPVQLRWDGQRWFVAVPGAPAHAPAQVDLSVAVDLGGWMLLRLRRAGAPHGSGSTWLPVQRRGHEAHWHALRCAVYSPRPASGDPSAAEP